MSQKKTFQITTIYLLSNNYAIFGRIERTQWFLNHLYVRNYLEYYDENNNDECYYWEKWLNLPKDISFICSINQIENQKEYFMIGPNEDFFLKYNNYFSKKNLENSKETGKKYFQFTSKTEIIVLYTNYRLVISLDISPSMLLFSSMSENNHDIIKKNDRILFEQLFINIERYLNYLLEIISFKDYFYVNKLFYYNF